jgi:hypothetical protein
MLRPAMAKRILDLFCGTRRGTGTTWMVTGVGTAERFSLFPPRSAGILDHPWEHKFGRILDRVPRSRYWGQPGQVSRTVPVPAQQIGASHYFSTAGRQVPCYLVKQGARVIKEELCLIPSVMVSCRVASMDVVRDARSERCRFWEKHTIGRSAHWNQG